MHPALRPSIVTSSLCVCLPDAFPAHWLGWVPSEVHTQVLSQCGLIIPRGPARSGLSVGAAENVAEPWCDSKALLGVRWWKGIHRKPLEKLCLQQELLLQPRACP